MAEPVTSNRTKSLAQPFISYRVRSDSALAHNIYFRLKANNVHEPWLDAQSLPNAQPWAAEFCDGLFKSGIFVPLMSKAGLAPFANLRADSACDNVLLEYSLALELYEVSGRHVRLSHVVCILLTLDARSAALAAQRDQFAAYHGG